jgi:acetyl esterase/lipase
MILIRALLLAVALLLATLPAAVVIGGFAPGLPTIGRFGGLVNSDMPWLLLEAVAGAVLSAIVFRMARGQPILRAIATMPILVAAGIVVMFAVLLAFAAQLGGMYSVLRQAQDAGSPPAASEVRTLATVDGADLRAAIWHVPSHASNAGAAPTVVFVHGGAFVGGGLGSRNWFFQRLANLGFGVVDVEYRLTPPPRWDEAPADVLCALAWLRGAGPDLGFDTGRVVIMGESAGGNLALMAGYAAGTDAITPSCPGDPVDPVGVIALAPTADLEGIWADRSIEVEDRPFPEEYIGGTPAQFPDRYAAASPFRLVRPGLPPTLIVGGANDHFVRPERVTSLCGRFAVDGNDCQLLMIPFVEHGFDGDPNGYGAQLEETIIPAFLAHVLG